MKNIIIIMIIALAGTALWANGMLIMSATNGSYMELYRCRVDVQINNQAAVTTTTMHFHNPTTAAWITKFAFPLQGNASATSLRWKVNGEWHDAVIAPGQQGGIVPPGDDIDPYIDEHLGKTPVVFSLPQTVYPDSNVVVQLTYVQLLPYSGGTVSYTYPADYGYLNATIVDTLSINLQVFSPRVITALDFPGIAHTPPVINGTTATCNFYINNFDPDQNVELTYSLAMDDLGIGSISTFMNQPNVPDELGDGFFLMLVEPEPSGEVIQKYFTFVIDRSATMNGTKLEQAKNAAAYMVNNLNPGDYFNIVDFSTIASAFAVHHMPYTTVNRNLALNYISHLQAFGSSNYSGAFDMAVPQFEAADPNAASILVFLTGSQANTGIVEMFQLFNHVNTLIDQTERNISLYCFGVGNTLNYQLLTLMADANNGFATSVGLNNLQEVLIDFYANIRNPLVLDPAVTFTAPANTIVEVYPNPLPNLYLGEQMLICGRYTTPQDITLNINGTAYGNPVNYSYDDALAGSEITSNVFLMKVWAKLKIEHLLREFYLLNPDSPEAEALYDQIVALSTDYGVLCEFTSFTGGEVGTDDQTQTTTAPVLRLLGNYPNPFNPCTQIKYAISSDKAVTVEIAIYNHKGQLIRTIIQRVTKGGTYELTWDGTDEQGRAVANGVYLYKVKAGEVQLSSKMILMK